MLVTSAWLLGLVHALVHMPLYSPRVDKREVILHRKASSYQTTLQIGGQNVTVIVDTGSSDLWVMDSSNPYCQNSHSDISSEDRINCNSGYMYQRGSTWSTDNTTFALSYGDGSMVEGIYGQDNVVAGDYELTGVNFAVGTSATISSGVFGIGPQLGEANIREFLYENFPMQLKSQGHISSLLYSLWLNSRESSEGVLLFGGIDTAKYNGTLGVVPVVSDTHFKVMLSSMELDGQTLVECSLPVMLDSGTTYSYLPRKLIEPFVLSLNAWWVEHPGLYAVTCTTNNTRIGLNFSGVQISIPLQEFLVPWDLDDGSMWVQDGEEICAFGIIPISDEPEEQALNVLGGSFLRGMYVVYDLENSQIGLAEANYATEKDVTSITTIPGSSASGYSVTQFKSEYTTYSPTVDQRDGTLSLSVTSRNPDPVETAQSTASSNGAIPRLHLDYLLMLVNYL